MIKDDPNNPNPAPEWLEARGWGEIRILSSIEYFSGNRNFCPFQGLQFFGESIFMKKFLNTCTY